MANCNCNDFPISCAPHAPGGDCCHPHGCPQHPCPPPPFKGGTSMYIGARYVPIFADPVEWDDEREYEPLTIVIHDGSCYTSKCYVPKGAQLPPYPEGQTKYWVKTSDYNYQFADLKKTVLDLSRLVEQFQKDNKTFTDLINGWNEKVQQWENEMTAWGERLDTVESNITNLTASLNAEIDRAKAAEQANAAAIAQETADRKQAISELDAAYKAADTAEAQTRADADTALSNRITANKTDIDSLKAEQAIQNTNISKNAKNISDNAAEIAKHAERLTSLESNASDWDDAFPDTTIAQEVQKEELARANADTALNGRCDTIAANVEEVRDIANHKVDQTVFNAADNLNVKYQDSTKRRIETPLLEVDSTTVTREYLNSAHALFECDARVWKSRTLRDFALKSEVDTAQAAADKANTNIGNWETDHPGKTIAQAVTDVSNSIPDVSGFVTETVYNQGQAAQDTKITAAQAAANKANTNIGDWETDHPNKTISECATSLENETAANAAKADANAAVIGDWNAEHPGKTIAQEVTRLGGAIPDVSGFVTEITYNQGQAAQDAKITAAQTAADKANTNIGDWETDHPGKTISQCATDLDGRARTNSATIGDWHTTYPTHTITQMVTNIRTDLKGIDYLNFLDMIYPEDNVIFGTRLEEATLYPCRYDANTTFTYFYIPIVVPYIVSAFSTLWTANINAPTTIIMYDVNGMAGQSKRVTSFKIEQVGNTSFFAVAFETPFNISATSIYYFRLHSTKIMDYNWTKNATPFSSLA